MTIRMTSPPKTTPSGTCNVCRAEYVWDAEDTLTIIRTERPRPTSGLYREGSVLTIKGIRCQCEGCPGLVPLNTP